MSGLTVLPPASELSVVVFEAYYAYAWIGEGGSGVEL